MKCCEQIHTEVFFFCWQGNRNFPSFTPEKTLYWSHIKQHANIVNGEAEHSGVTSETERGGRG